MGALSGTGTGQDHPYCGAGDWFLTLLAQEEPSNRLTAAWQHHFKQHGLEYVEKSGDLVCKVGEQGIDIGNDTKDQDTAGGAASGAGKSFLSGEAPQRAQSSFAISVFEEQKSFACDQDFLRIAADSMVSDLSAKDAAGKPLHPQRPSMWREVALLFGRSARFWWRNPKLLGAGGWPRGMHACIHAGVHPPQLLCCAHLA